MKTRKFENKIWKSENFEKIRNFWKSQEKIKIENPTFSSKIEMSMFFIEKICLVKISRDFFFNHSLISNIDHNVSCNITCTVIASSRIWPFSIFILEFRFSNFDFWFSDLPSNSQICLIFSDLPPPPLFLYLDIEDFQIYFIFVWTLKHFLEYMLKFSIFSTWIERDDLQYFSTICF